MTAHTLLYAGGAIGQYWLRGEVAQDSTSTYAGGTYVRSDGGHADTVGLGLLFNWTHFQFSLAADRTHLDYGHTTQQEDVYLHAGFYISPR